MTLLDNFYPSQASHAQAMENLQRAENLARSQSQSFAYYSGVGNIWRDNGTAAFAPVPSFVARTAASRVKTIETPEDYRDYLADKGLAQAYKQKAEMAVTHSYQALLRKWVDYLNERPES